MNKYNDLIEEQAARDATIGKVVTIVTKPVSTPYVKRPVETFKAIVLPDAVIPGIDQKSHIRVLKDNLHTEIIRLDRIATIDGKSIEPPKNKWKVKGSGTAVHTVTRNGDIYSCTCKGFFYRRSCRHVREIKGE